MSTDLNEMKLPAIFRHKQRSVTEKLGGKPFIHAIGNETDQYLLTDAFYGHSILFGSPGTGKTTLLNMLSTGTLNRGNFNLIIDPKPDSDWEKRMRKECEVMGVPFHYFSTSHPTKSVRIDPLRDYERVSDIPQRIIDVATAKSSDANDPFLKFTWKCVNQVVQAMHYVSIPAQLKSISYYLRFAQNELADMVLRRFFEEHFKEGSFAGKLRQMKASDGSVGSLLAMIEYYQDNIKKDARLPEVDGIVTFVTHDRSHREKMLSSTDPLFEQLTSAPLDKLLSPNLDELLNDDPNSYILNLEEMLENGGCLYIALNSMADSSMAGAIGKLILSAVSSAASRRYSFEEGKGRRVSLFCDEAHACLNDKLIDLLAVGRGAQFEIVLSTQTLNDFEAKADAATAKRLLGLASNLFALRVGDDATQKYVSENFGEVDAKKITYAKQDRDSGANIMSEHSSGYSETLDKESKLMFPPQAVGDIPNLQYIARTQSGKKIKGRIPILLDD
jgi:conjugal transfer pilus assembly protein TraD